MARDIKVELTNKFFYSLFFYFFISLVFVFESLNEMTNSYNYFRENTEKITAIKKIKSINANDIETLYESPWLKFRDIENWTVQESPCTELMALARESGIRPQTTANGIKNMFFIHEQYLADFLICLEKKYPEFAKFVIQKTQMAKENSNVKEINELPHWF